MNLALDGSTVFVDGLANMGPTATTYAFAATHEFESGPLSLGREIASEYGIDEFDESYEVQGGTLYRATRLVVDHKKYERLFSLALWEGADHSVNTEVPPDTSSRDVVDLFNLFTITDSAEGIVLKPQDSQVQFGQEWKLAPAVVKFVPGLGILVVRPRTGWTEAQMPPWAGQRVRHGEMYKGEPGPDGRRLFLHASDTGISTVWPERDRTTNQRVAEDVSELNVRWER